MTEPCVVCLSSKRNPLEEPLSRTEFESKQLPIKCEVDSLVYIRGSNYLEMDRASLLHQSYVIHKTHVCMRTLVSLQVILGTEYLSLRTVHVFYRLGGVDTTFYRYIQHITSS